ncbi:MAG: hypothetical protein A2178_01735 [Planctomycetes bacterium GWC2_49_10]|nr:MAG: hypothetical protein A2178_01735 [Planctomycetes bacterium GWC2_49_10]
MKRLIRNALNKCGFDVIRTRNLHDDLTKHLSNVLLSKNIDCVIDVGANSGQYGLFLRALGYKGHIVSFEPVSSVFNQLKEKCENDNKWSCHNFALGDKNEEKILNVYKSTVFSSFLTANEYSKNIWHSLENVTPETVKVFRLEDVWDDAIGKLGCTNYMLKLDTQGFDKFVFDGAHDCLENISVLQSELSLIPVYDGMIQVYDVLKEFHSFNFFISGMYPINRDKSLAVIEYDCVMVKRLPE